MLLENEHKVDAQPVPSERSRNARWVAKVAILFTFAWAIYALIETAAPLLAETYRPLLKTPQSIAQYNASDPFGQTLLRIRSSIPAKKPVVILWRVPDSDPHQVNTEYSFWYALVWSSYWLYPHQVQVVMGEVVRRPIIECGKVGLRRVFVHGGHLAFCCTRA